MNTAISKLTSTEELAPLRERLLAEDRAYQARVRVCIGTGCAAKGSRDLYERFCELASVAASGDGEARIVQSKHVGCHGLCERGPIVLVEPGNILYQSVEASDVEEIFHETVLAGRVVERLLYDDPATHKRARTPADIPFYAVQQRIVLEHSGHVDPTSIHDYICEGGYSVLAKALSTMEPEQIIREVELSGLRGRGGGGFPTGRKWRFCREASGGPKHVICNGDEGDPGAFMDRSILEGNPHSVLEGMIIGAYAIGASQGYVYVRAEYPIAVKHLTIAIEQAEQLGLLGKSILGTPFSFSIKIKRGAGAFVCGEETALMASIEGSRGMPRPRPPFPAQSGVWGKPTCLNNVETWANISPIISKGGAWYAGIGTEKSTGTKVFALTGKVNNTGLVEVPMGIPLRRIVFDIGGGILGGTKFKAVQTGGPSGGCIPASHLDMPVDFESLASVGSIMGSGGLIVVDERTCMVDFARFFMEFIQDESCGKCVPCRIGTKRMLEILVDICEARGTLDDIEVLQELAHSIKDTALCGLGQTAPNPVLTTLAYFREEYLAHIQEHRCPAGVCKALIRYEIIPEACTGCQACFKVCPTKAVSGERKQVHFIHQEKCIKCGLCHGSCRFDAIAIR